MLGNSNEIKEIVYCTVLYSIELARIQAASKHQKSKKTTRLGLPNQAYTTVQYVQYSTFWKKSFSQMRLVSKLARIQGRLTVCITTAERGVHAKTHRSYLSKCRQSLVVWGAVKNKRALTNQLPAPLIHSGCTRNKYGTYQLIKSIIRSHELTLIGCKYC